MAAVNTLQRLRQDPKARFAHYYKTLCSNTAGYFLIRILSYLVLSRTVSRRLPLKDSGCHLYHQL
jgi:hypothetical protein